MYSVSATYVDSISKDDIKRDPRLKYASKELKNNRDFVLAAIKQEGRALEFASEELKNNSDIVIVLYNRIKNNFNYRFTSKNKIPY